MEKQVWRVNAGQGVPSDLGDGLLFGDGQLGALTGDFENNRNLWIFAAAVSHENLDITAYQTNRTRKAKYERVECMHCDGHRDIVGVSKCARCNGKGWRLVKIRRMTIEASQKAVMFIPFNTKHLRLAADELTELKAASTKPRNEDIR